MKVFTKESLIAELSAIHEKGWIPSFKRPGNDGAVGNTLENLLEITENNLPLPNATEWELKGQRRQTGSLLTLFHKDPSPTAMSLVTTLLLPKYGWPLEEHPNEWSFRQTISASSYSDRGFRVVIDDDQRKVNISFNADVVSEKHRIWLESVESRIGLTELNPQPYWGFDDLEHKAGAKLTNTFYILADARTQDGVEYFYYNGVLMLQTFSFDGFLAMLRNGSMKIDFDARTGHGRRGHNHGTKFRIPPALFPNLYETAVSLLDAPLTREERLNRIDTTNLQSTAKPPKRTVKEQPGLFETSFAEQEN